MGRSKIMRELGTGDLSRRLEVKAFTPGHRLVTIKEGFRSHRDARNFTLSPKARELEIRFGFKLFVG